MRSISLSAIMALLILAGATHDGWASSGGPPDGYTNAPGESVCTACHNSFQLNSGDGSLILNNLPERYLLGETYRLEVALSDPDAQRWGFELTAKDADRNGAGEFTRVDADRTQISDPGGNAAEYVKHTSDGTNAGQADGNSWEVDWTAPEEDIGEIGFYLAGNAANNNGQNTNDRIYAVSFAIEAEEPPPPPDEWAVALESGWNLISSPVTPAVANLDSIFAALNAAQILIVLRDRNGAVYNPINGIRDLADWDAANAYQIKVNEGSEVDFSGAFTDTAHQYELFDGWNWLSYPRRDSIFVTEAMAPLGDNLLLVKNNEGLIYTPELEFNQLGYIYPGKVWKVEIVSENATPFTWPRLQNVHNIPEPPPETHHYDQPANSGRSMNIVVSEWLRLTPEVGDEVAVYDAGELCGAAAVEDGLFNIVVWGDDDTSPEATEGPGEGDELSFRLFSNAAQNESDIFATPLNFEDTTRVVYQTDRIAIARLWVPEPDGISDFPIRISQFALGEVYPNPFNHSSVISYQLPVSGKVNLELYDIRGRLVETLVEEWQSAGEHRVVIGGQAGTPAPLLATGLYIVSLQSGADRLMKTVVVIK